MWLLPDFQRSSNAKCHTYAECYDNAHFSSQLPQHINNAYPRRRTRNHSSPKVNRSTFKRTVWYFPNALQEKKIDDNNTLKKQSMNAAIERLVKPKPADDELITFMKMIGQELRYLKEDISSQNCKKTYS